MVDFIQTQESEIKNLTEKVKNHFNKNTFARKNKNHYQKLLENRMISQEYMLKDSCNIFSKKQIDEQFFVTLPDLQEILETEKKLVNKWEQKVNDNKENFKKQSENSTYERIYTIPSKLEVDESECFIKNRRSTGISTNLEKRDPQNDNNNGEKEFIAQSQYLRRFSLEKSSFLMKNSSQPSKTNYGKMPTYNNYQKLKLSQQYGMQTFHSNFYSTFYETPKLGDDFSPFQQLKKQLNQKHNTQPYPLIDQIQNFDGQQQQQRRYTNDLDSSSPTRKVSDNIDKYSSFFKEQNITTDFQPQQNDKNLKECHSRKRDNVNNQVELNQNYSIQQTPLKKIIQKTNQQEAFQRKFDKFKFINRIDLEMGVNYSFKDHLDRLKSDKDTLQNFHNHLNQINLGQQPGHISTQVNQNSYPWDSKNNLSVISRNINSQIQSKAQLNSRINVSKTNALSTSQLSVKDGRKNSRRRRNEDLYAQDYHGSSQTSSNQTQQAKNYQQNNLAVIDLPNSLLRSSKMRQSILSLQSQSVVQNINFPLQFITSLSREESAKINTVQSFFPDFINNLRFLEKSKQTKKRAARALKKTIGWSDKMAPLILNEDGTEIKKDLDFQTGFFEEVLRNQKINTMKEISSNKKENSNSKQNIQLNTGLTTLNFDAIWENFQKYQYLNKNLIESLEKKEKEIFKQYRSQLLEEIIDIHKLQSKQLNKFPLSNKQYQFIVSLPKNIQHILDRKNYLQKEQALDNIELHEINLGQFPYLLTFQRIRSKYINQSNEVIRNYEKHV